MHQAIKTLYITFGLLIIATLSFYFLLYPFSPRGVQEDIYTLRFMGNGWENRYQIQGDQMICQRQPEHDDLTTTCITSFEGKPLTIEVAFNDETRHLASWCRVVYDGQAISCQPTINYENIAPTLVINDSLGIKPERYEELRSQTPLLYVLENQWIELTQGIALIFGLILAVWRWWYYPKISCVPVENSSRLILSGLVGLFSWFTLAWGLMFLMNDWMLSLTEKYIFLSPMIGTLGGASAFVWEWKMLGGWKPETAVYRIIYTIGGGFVIFSALNFLLMISLLFLGFID